MLHGFRHQAQGHQNADALLVSCSRPRRDEDDANASYDLFKAEWLGDVIVAADGQASDLVFGCVTSRKKQERAPAPLRPGDGELRRIRRHQAA